jgi:hypothetical protein
LPFCSCLSALAFLLLPFCSCLSALAFLLLPFCSCLSALAFLLLPFCSSPYSPGAILLELFLWHRSLGTILLILSCLSLLACIRHHACFDVMVPLACIVFRPSDVAACGSCVGYILLGLRVCSAEHWGPMPVAIEHRFRDFGPSAFINRAGT